MSIVIINHIWRNNSPEDAHKIFRNSLISTTGAICLLGSFHSIKYRPIKIMSSLLVMVFPLFYY